MTAQPTNDVSNASPFLSLKLLFQTAGGANFAPGGAVQQVTAFCITMS